MRISITNSCFKESLSWSKCSICAETCPKAAISVHEKNVRLEPALCDQCGACVLACPAGAIIGPAPLRHIEEDILFSDDYVQPTEKELLSYYQAGIRNIQVNHLHINWLTLVDNINTKLQALRCSPYQIKISTKKVAHISSARRSLLGLRRKLPISIKNAPLNSLFPGFSFFNLSLNENTCTLCGACQHICPSRAISISERAFTLHTQICTGCALCTQACPEKSLHIEENISEEKYVQYPLRKYTCTSCQSVFSDFENKAEAGELLCSACKVRQKLGLPSETISQGSITNLYRGSVK